MFDRTTFWRLARYGAVGMASNLVGYLLYISVTYMGLGPKVAMTLLYVSGATIGYLGNRQLAFYHTGSILRSSAGYLVAHAGGYAANFAILFAFVDMLGYSHQLVQAVAILVVAGYLFLVLNFIVFKDEKVREVTS